MLVQFNAIKTSILPLALHKTILQFSCPKSQKNTLIIQKNLLIIEKWKVVQPKITKKGDPLCGRIPHTPQFFNCLRYFFKKILEYLTGTRIQCSYTFCPQSIPLPAEK